MNEPKNRMIERSFVLYMEMNRDNLPGSYTIREMLHESGNIHESGSIHESEKFQESENIRESGMIHETGNIFS